MNTDDEIIIKTSEEGVFINKELEILRYGETYPVDEEGDIYYIEDFISNMVNKNDLLCNKKYIKTSKENWWKPGKNCGDGYIFTECGKYGGYKCDLITMKNIVDYVEKRVKNISFNQFTIKAMSYSIAIRENTSRLLWIT